MAEPLTLAELEHNDPTAPSRPRERRFLCPLPACRSHQHLRHRSLAVNVETGAFVCHRCQARGKIRDRWEPRGRRSGREQARRAFAPQPATHAVEPIDATTIGVPIEESPAGLLYLGKRGIPADLAAAAGLRFASSWSGSDTVLGRPAVLFPMQDEHGTNKAVQGRAIAGSAKLTRGPKSTTVFATPGAFEADVLGITEGPIDALSLARCGLPSLALAGTSAPEWVRRRYYGRTVLLATDADDAGAAAAAQLAQWLEAFSIRTRRLRPPCKDWNEALLKQGAAAVQAQIMWHVAAADDLYDCLLI